MVWRSHNLRVALSIMKYDPWRKETYHVQKPIYRKCEPSLTNCLNFFRQSIMNVTREFKGQFQNITCRNPQESYIYLNEHLNCSLRSCPLPIIPLCLSWGRGHDTFLCRITCKNARIWTFFWLDRKQCGWFALFRLAKMTPSVSCCWFQSAFLLA